MTRATRTPVEHARLVQCGRSWFPEQRDASFDDARDCWDVIGWLMVAAFVVFLAFFAGLGGIFAHFLLRWLGWA